MSDVLSKTGYAEITKYVAWACVVWAAVIGMSFVIGANQSFQEAELLARNEASSNFDKDQAFRLWATRHGGVYVQTNERTPPNPYLSHIPDRDIATTSGKQLTLMNPAYMLRQMMGEYSAEYGVRGRITSLDPLNPDNAPDPWEQQALAAFEQGAEEVVEYTSIEGQPFLRLMRPMVTREGCLKCHGHQDYEIGDVRGGVGVSVPMAGYESLARKQVTNSALSHVAILVVGLGGIVFLGRASRRRYDDYVALHEAQETLAENAKRLANAQRIAQLGDWRLDIATQKLTWSEEVYRIFGLPPGRDDVTFSVFLDCVHPDDRDMVDGAVKRALGHEPYNIYYRIVRPDSLERIVHDVGEVEFDDDDKPVHFNGTVHDVTASRQVAIELEETRHYLQNILDSMPSMLIGVDTDLNVTHWNSQAHQLSGVSSDDARGQALEEIIPQLSAQISRVKTALATNEPEIMSKVAFSMNGETRYSDIVIFPLVANSVRGAVIRVDDVTDRVRIEEMMVQTEKMLSVGGLAAGMAHEINNPLSGMLQSLQNIKRRLDADFEKNRKTAEEVDLDLQALQRYMDKRGIATFFDAILEAGARASTIVRNMLQFSRRAGTHKEPVDLAKMLDLTLDIASVDYDLKKKYDFRSIEIDRNYDSELAKVPCILSEMQQVLLNILGNAAQAFQEQTGRDGPPHITVSTQRVGDFACISVADNGPGMSDETKRRVFEPFFTTKPVGQGTGLGLSVSYFIVNETHGGRINVESALGQGSKFMIYLPLEPRKERRQA